MTTIKDIAKLADVSIATVSRVLNNSKPVSFEVRDKVLGLLAETGYHPNAIARSLVSKETHIIGVMIPDLANDNFAHLIKGIESVLGTYGYSIFLAITGGKTEKEIKYFQLFKEKQLDGVILSGVQYVEEHENFFKNNQIPLVAVGQEFSQYLLEQGHRRIAFISAPLNDQAAGMDRLLGFKKALMEYQCPVAAIGLWNVCFN